MEDGFDDLSKLLEGYLEKTEKALDMLEICAKEYVSDVRKLPKPRSQVNKAGYTHLIDTVAYQRKKEEIEVGWGKYYGPMVERGTRRMKKAHPHLKPTFERNKEKYYKKIEEFYK